MVSVLSLSSLGWGHDKGWFQCCSLVLRYSWQFRGELPRVGRCLLSHFSVVLILVVSCPRVCSGCLPVYGFLAVSSSCLLFSSPFFWSNRVRSVLILVVSRPRVCSGCLLVYGFLAVSSSCLLFSSPSVWSNGIRSVSLRYGIRLL